MATRPMTDAEQVYTYHRMRRLPDVIAAAERKLAGLYREAARYGMDDLLESPKAFSEAWDREVAVAKLESFVRDGGEPYAG